MGCFHTPRLRFREMADDDLDEGSSRVANGSGGAGTPYLVAIIPENLPSQRVAEKIGLRLERRVFKNGGDALVFGAELQCALWGLAAWTGT